MTPDDNWEIFTALELHKPDSDRIRLWSWKVKLVIGFFMIIFFVFLAVLFILELTESTRVIRSVKTKRFVKMEEYRDESESRTAQNDIHIVPQRRQEDMSTRTNQHPNHRYLDVEPKANIYKKIMKDLYDESGWSPKPFDVKAEEYLDSVRNIMSKKKTENSGSPMRFKGVFGYALPDDRNSEKFRYSKEINGLVQNYSGSKGEEKVRVKNPGAPFKVPVKGREKLNLNRQSLSKPNQSRFQNKPLTIFLDIYPMAETHDNFRKEKLKLKPSQKEFSKSGDIYSTRQFPNEMKNGIIMKLNLYTKRRKLSKHQNLSGEDEIRWSDPKRAEDKSFGWFSTKKEEKRKEPKQCSLMALKPHGKHVTAKWKNENGEWIHAKHLSVKYLKKKSG